MPRQPLKCPHACRDRYHMQVKKNSHCARMNPRIALATMFRSIPATDIAVDLHVSVSTSTYFVSICKTFKAQHSTAQHQNAIVNITSRLACWRISRRHHILIVLYGRHLCSTKFSVQHQRPSGKNEIAYSAQSASAAQVTLEMLVCFLPA